MHLAKSLFPFLSVVILCSASSVKAAVKVRQKAKPVQLQTIVDVGRFGATPDDGQNDADALRQAAAYCRLHPGTTLTFSPGTYDFRDEEAVRIEREAISGAYGEDVQGRLFQPKGPYVKGLNFNGCRRLTIKAYGATLLMQGWYEVLSFQKAHDINIEGLTITYKRPASTLGPIVTSTDEYFDFRIDPKKYCYMDSIVTGRVHFFDAVRERIYYGGVSRKQLVNDSTIRMYSTLQPTIGDYCIIRHGGHYRPCIMLKESSDIMFRDVKILSHPGMGVVGHLSKNITLEDLQVVPEPGSVISTNTDATHFTSCSGYLNLRHCKFKGNGDDCTNIHNYYYHFYPESPRRAEIRIEGADLHAQSLDYPEVGDTMLVLQAKNMQEQGRYVVLRVDTSTAQWKVVITLDKDMPVADANKYYMTNVTRYPTVSITDNDVSCHMGRAFLVKAPNVYIARNSIKNTTHTAIKLGAEFSWREAGPTSHAIIEDNYVSGCGYAIGADEASCVMTSTESILKSPFLNRNIIIRNNIFASTKKYAIVLKDAAHVVIDHNRVTPGYDAIRQDNCEDVVIR